MFEQRGQPYRALRRLRTRDDVAQYLGVSERTVGRLGSEGSIGAVRVGRLVRFRDAEVAALASSVVRHRSGAAPGKRDEAITPGLFQMEAEG